MIDSNTDVATKILTPEEVEICKVLLQKILFLSKELHCTPDLAASILLLKDK
jgi:hypothetical protein